MTERLSPDEVVAAIQAAETEDDARKIERLYVQDTGEEDPGKEDDLGHDPEDGESG